MAQTEQATPSTGSKEANGSLKGVISPDGPASDEIEPLQNFPGPTVHNKPTTVHLLNRAQLISSGLIPQLTALINTSFKSQSVTSSGILQGRDRLRYDGQLLDELGHAPETFIYILATEDGSEIAGTAYASRYVGVEAWPEGGERTWQRLGVVGEGTEAWELHILAVNPAFQRQGIAGYLMKIVEEEILRRVEGEEEEAKEVVFFISTIKEENEAFYLKKGFKENYAVQWPAGHLGSPVGWTVTHMHRRLR